MLGAIIGDIVGSVYEFQNIKTKKFELLRHDCFFTDDTVMTVAVAVFLARKGDSKDEIRGYVETNFYPMDFCLNDIRSTYEFDETCPGSVPPGNCGLSGIHRF